MSEIVIENARIKSTFLGFSNGVLTCLLDLGYSGGGQGFGNLTFDCPVKENGLVVRRVGSAYGTEFIASLLRVVGVDSWEQLVGKYVRAKHNYDKVFEIGNIIKDEWFNPDTLRNQMVEQGLVQRV